MSVKALLCVVAAVTVCACSSYTPPPEPFGPKVPVNFASDKGLSHAAKARSELRQAVLLDEELHGVRRINAVAYGQQTEDKSLGLKDVKNNRFKK